MGVRNTEKKYTNLIWEWLSSESFLADLRDIEDYIITNYKILDQRWQIKNKLKVAAERLVRFYSYSNFNVKGIYPCPISSDLAFFTDDALLNIDAKTIDMVGNPGDDRSIQFDAHQISFTNRPLGSRTLPSGHVFSGARLFPGLPIMERGLPCLTFIISVCYNDDGRNFSLSHIDLFCVPNGEIVENDYNNNLISNYKTYKYLGKDEAAYLGMQYIPKSTSSFVIPDTWVPFSMQTGSANIDSWLDTNLDHPYYKGEKACWRIMEQSKWYKS